MHDRRKSEYPSADPIHLVKGLTNFIYLFISDKMQRAFTCQMLSSGGSFNPLCLTGFAGLFGGA